MHKLLKIIVPLIFLSGTISSHSQSLDDFYSKGHWELFTPVSGYSTKLQNGDSAYPYQSYWGIINIGGFIRKSKPLGISFAFSNREIGDLMYVLMTLVLKPAAISFNIGSSDNFPKINNWFLSDFLIPNFRFGLNVFCKENEGLVVNAGINHSYNIASGNGQLSQSSEWLSIGPNFYVDQVIMPWLAVHVETSPLFVYAGGYKGGPGKEVKEKPSVWENRIELFTTYGFFMGVEFIKFSNMLDIPSQTYFKIRRYDFRLGFRTTF